jgi:uncharacterized membrane protein HdeD (DUF308 family)
MPVTEAIETAASERTRHRGLAICGGIIILLSAGAALLPLIDPNAGAHVVGSLLFAAGVVEIYAGTLHWRAKGLAALAGVVTAIAGLLFAFNPETHFMGTAVVVTGWLLLRSFILVAAGVQSVGLVRRWTLSSAAMDFFLSLLLLIGLSISTLIVALFGPTSEVVAGFAWILALSFIVTGAMLVEIAACEGGSSK